MIFALADLKDLFPTYTINIERNEDGPPVGKPINIEIKGDDYIALLNESERMKSVIENSSIEGIESIDLELETGVPELLIKVIRQKQVFLAFLLV